MKFSEKIILFIYSALASQISWHLDIKLLRGSIDHYLLMHIEPAREIVN